MHTGLSELQNISFTRVYVYSISNSLAALFTTKAVVLYMRYSNRYDFLKKAPLPLGGGRVLLAGARSVWPGGG